MQKTSNFINLDAGHFSLELFNETECRSWILKQLHPEGAKCPNCGTPVISEKTLSTWAALGRVSCRSCSRFFTAATGTMIQGAKIDLRTLYCLALFLSLQVPVAKIVQILKVSHGTVTNWGHRLQTLGSDQADPEH